MPFKVQVGPEQISIHQGQTVLITSIRRELLRASQVRIAARY